MTPNFSLLCIKPAGNLAVQQDGGIAARRGEVKV